MKRELRYVLLAAMETSWVYAVIALLGAVTRTPIVSPLSLLAVYWTALLVGRSLPRLQQRWGALQLVSISIALLSVLVVMRVEILGNRIGWLDMTWLPAYLVSVFTLHETFPGQFLATLSVLYMFIRGLGFGQRPLTLWFVGFQFRLGVLVFFLVLIAAAVAGDAAIRDAATAGDAAASVPYDATVWIFVYFFLALLAVALARVDDVGTHMPLGPRWMVTLIGAVALVIVLGLVVLQFFTLDAANALFTLLSPVFALLAALLLLFAIPLAIVAEWLLNWLEPLFRELRFSIDVLMNLLPQNAAEDLQRAFETNPYLDWLGAFLRLAFIATLVIGAGLLIARALNRRMQAREAEEYQRESLGSDEDSARVRAESRPKKTTRRRSGDATAETIRRIYAALIARANEAGLPRRAAETPNEFLPRLQRNWPAQAQDIEAITEAYVAVHYAERAASKEELDHVRTAWDKIIRKT